MDQIVEILNRGMEEKRQGESKQDRDKLRKIFVL